MSGDRELAVVTGTSGDAAGGAEQRSNRQGETSNPCDYDQSSCGLAFLSSPDWGGWLYRRDNERAGFEVQAAVGTRQRSKVTNRTSARKNVFFQVSKLFAYGCTTAVETRS